ncbi:MAG: hypothetical protein AB9834_17035 [Lentimicrobium sp.]
MSQIGAAFPYSLNKPEIIQVAPEQSPDCTENIIIQAVLEQSPVTDEGPIRQALPRELEAIDIRAIQISAKARDLDSKPRLNPVRLLQTLA